MLKHNYSKKVNLLLSHLHLIYFKVSSFQVISLLTNFITGIMRSYLTSSKPGYNKSILNVDDSKDMSVLIKPTKLNLFSFIKN